jgi:hypothetical protein
MTATASQDGRITESILIRVAPEEAYATVSDVTLMGRWSPECRGARVIGRDRTPRVGMRFIGRNRGSWLPWATLCRVVEAEPARSFAFQVSFLGISLARWSYEFTAVAEGCEVTEEWRDRRAGIAARVLAVLTPLVTGVVGREERNRATMRATLLALRKDLESGHR